MGYSKISQSWDAYRCTLKCYIKYEQTFECIVKLGYVPLHGISIWSDSLLNSVDNLLVLGDINVDVGVDDNPIELLLDSEACPLLPVGVDVETGGG